MQNRVSRLLKIFAVIVLLVGVSSAEAKTFELINGDTLSGTLVQRTPDELIIDHPVLGRLSIPVYSLKLPATNPGLFGTSFLKGWDKELDLGFHGKQGNSDNNNISVGLDLSYADDKQRWKIEGKYSLADSDGDTDSNDGYLSSHRDWLFTGSRWFAFTLGRYDFDQFESWRHRVYWGGGPGYHFLQAGPFTLDGRFALGGGYEFGDMHEFTPLALLSLEGKWKLSEVHSLSFSNTVLPRLDEAEFLNRTAAEWKIRISEVDGLNLKLGLHNAYDTDAQDKNNIFKYTGTLPLDF